MATFLQLVQRGRLEASMPIPPITGVAAAGDDVARLVAWTQDSWRDIQLMDRDWRWMRRQTLATVTAVGGMRYTPTQMGVPAGTGLSRWRVEGEDMTNASGYRVRAARPADLSQEWTMRFLPLPLFTARFLVGTHAAGAPQFWSEADNGDFLIGPRPDASYQVRADYVRAPQELVADGDTPEMPVAYHLAIMWRALYTYAVDDAAPELIARARQSYNSLESALMRDQGARTTLRIG